MGRSNQSSRPTDIEWLWANLWEELVGEKAAQASSQMLYWPKRRLRSKTIKRSGFGYDRGHSPVSSILPGDEAFQYRYAALSRKDLPSTPG
jgi:hypothetical protein